MYGDPPGASVHSLPDGTTRPNNFHFFSLPFPLRIPEMSPKPKSQRAPSFLSAEAKRLYRQIVTDFVLDGHHTRLLDMLCQSWDEWQTARKAIDKHGQTFIDRYGQVRERPELATIRQARNSFRQLYRELNLDGSTEPDGHGPRGGRYR